MRPSPVPVLFCCLGLIGESVVGAQEAEGVLFEHVVTVKFAGEPEYPVNVNIRDAYLGPIIHSFLVPDDAPLSIRCRLPPGDYVIESVLAQPSDKYWDATARRFTVRERDDFGRILALPQEFFHRLKIEVLGPKNDYVAEDEPPLLSWKPVPGATKYRLYWTEKRAPEKRSERDGSLEVETPFFDFDLELTPGARYEWQVDAFDEKNRSIAHWGPSYFFADEEAREAFENPPERPDRGGYLGVMIGETNHPVPGIRISQVLPDTPAFEAGLQPGDVFTQFAGIPVGEISIAAFIDIARSQEPGEPVEIEFSRGFGNPESLKSTLIMGKRPDFLE